MSQKQTKSLISQAIAKAVQSKGQPLMVAAKPSNKKAAKKKKSSTQSSSNRFPSGKQIYPNRSSRNVALFDEYVADVNGSVAFATTAYAFNPGQSVTFPRFNKEAILFEKWTCISAEPYYKPQVSAFATNGQAGKVLLSFDYDPSDAPPATKQQVEDSDPHSDCMPYEYCTLVLDPRLLNGNRNGKFVRPGGLPGSASIHDFDGGTLFVSTIGNTNATNIGELRIKSSWILEKPILENTIVAPTNFHVSRFESTAAEAMVSGVNLTLKLATTTANGLIIAFVAGVGTLPVGNYVVTGNVSFLDTTNTTTATLMNILVNGVALPYQPTSGFAGATNGQSNSSATWFISSTGSTTIALTATQTGGGTLTALGALTVLSV